LFESLMWPPAPVRYDTKAPSIWAKLSSVTGAQTLVSDDDEIIDRVLHGEIDRFAELIAEYQQHVVKIVSRHVPPDYVAKVAHEVFVQAYGSLARFYRQAPFEHWLSRIAVRTCYDFWRALRQTAVPVSTLTAEHELWLERMLAEESEGRFREHARQREAADLVQWALGRLSAEHRLVLTLVYLEGHSVREAADLLGWSVINVKVRAHRARQALRTLFRSEMGADTHDTAHRQRHR
jgi:RNA polymerase sigma-70 factor, ECF subfamily